MHKNTKLTPVLRKEVYKKWRTGSYSLRSLAAEYHVDKKVIQRVIERGKQNDFSIHNSVNLRYKKKPKRSIARTKGEKSASKKSKTAQKRSK